MSSEDTEKEGAKEIYNEVKREAHRDVEQIGYKRKGLKLSKVIKSLKTYINNMMFIKDENC